MSIDQILNHKKKSPAGNSSHSPWNDKEIGFPAMCRKTVLRQVLKLAPLGIEELEKSNAVDGGFIDKDIIDKNNTINENAVSFEYDESKEVRAEIVPDQKEVVDEETGEIKEQESKESPKNSAEKTQTDSKKKVDSSPSKKAASEKNEEKRELPPVNLQEKPVIAAKNEAFETFSAKWEKKNGMQRMQEYVIKKSAFQNGKFSLEKYMKENEIKVLKTDIENIYVFNNMSDDEQIKLLFIMNGGKEK
jgi:hypothetical protein